MNDAPALRGLGRFQVVAWGTALVGGLLLILGFVLGVENVFASYLFGYLFWLGLTLGCFLVVMLHHLTGGRWGYPLRRFYEAGMLTLPVMAVLFVPIWFGLEALYPWAHPPGAEQAHDKVHYPAAYLNRGGYVARTIIYFLLWSGLIFILRRLSLAQDLTTDAEPTRRMRTWSGPGIVIFPLTATFAYVDWVMSLEAGWFSTIFGVIVLIGQILTAFAFGILLLTWFGRREPLKPILTTTHYHHLGNLLWAFTIFFTYVSLAQFLIIYSGNLPHEVVWYTNRTAGNWKWVVLFLALFHFLFPFLMLLFRGTKRHLASLAILAAIIFLAHTVNVFWFIKPTFYPHGLQVSWVDLAAWLAFGGLWLGMFVVFLRRAPLLPQQDPGLQFSLSHAGH